MFFLFDIDNTLVYSDGRDSHAFASSFSDLFDQPLPSVQWQDYPHVTDQVIVEHIFDQYMGRPPLAEEIDAWMDEYVLRMTTGRARYPEEYRTVSHAAETVERLRSEGFSVGIASGGFRRPQELKLRHAGIETKGLVSAYADGQPTRAHILRNAVEQAPPELAEQTVYIGDALWDLHTTRELKMPFVGVRRQGDHHVLLEAGARAVVTDFSDWDVFWRACQQALEDDR
jgi:phosphoglycolate phosphatase-like HAD superfamily hydrolase